MALIDTVKRITVEEFPDDQKETAERIGNIYNYFAEQVTNAINGNLDFDNLRRTTITIEVSVDANGNPIQTTQFSSDTGLQGTTVLQATNLTNRVNYVDGHPFISFTSQGTGVYVIENIKGLNVNEQYQLTVELVF